MTPFECDYYVVKMLRTAALLTVGVVLAAAPAMGESIWWQEYTTDANTAVLWHLNETSGATVDDASANNNDATLYNMENGDWVAGKLGNALYFGQETSPPDYNSDEYGEAADSASLDISEYLTLEAWVNPDAQNSDAYFGNGIVAKNSAYILGVTDGLAVGASIYGGSSWYVSQSVGGLLTQGQWSHVAMTYDYTEGSVRLYLNGIELSDDDYASKSTGGGAISTSNHNVSLGRHTGNYCYDGRIDEVRISNTVREFAVIPEPGSLVLLGSGLLAGLLLLTARRRARRS